MIDTPYQLALASHVTVMSSLQIKRNVVILNGLGIMNKERWDLYGTKEIV